MASLEDRILSNPLRVQILEQITANRLTRSEISAMVDKPYGTVDYHTRLLRDAGSIRRVDSDGSPPSDPLYEAG